LILPIWGIDAVFVMFGLFALIGAVVAFFFAVETRARILDSGIARPGGPLSSTPQN
jgi:hypothetical protein